MSITINGVRLDDPQRPYIIAEASGNHHQDYTSAELLVRVAASAGADAVKFQTFTPEEICADVPILFGHDAAHDAWCQRLGVTRMRELFAKGGLPRAWHASLRDLAASLGLAFLSTPFSVDAARFLVNEIGVPALKIASGDLTYTPLLAYAARTGLPVILSTGGATMPEVRTACNVFWEADAGHIVVLHCVSVYPCDDALVNIAAVRGLRKVLCLPVGFSDHTLSVDLIPSLAVALGATVLEKHLRLDHDTTSVDAAHALTPTQFRQYVEAARRTPAVLGHGWKEPQEEERHDRLWSRRGKDGLRPTDAARKGRWE